MRHSPKTIQNIIGMRNSGLTLGEIVSKTGLSKTTIFHHIKRIQKSDILINKLRVIILKKQKIITDRRRGKSVKSYSFLKPEGWNPDLVNLIAHFIFDGDIRATSSNYNNRNKALINSVRGNMAKAIGVTDCKSYKNIHTGVIKLCYFNVEIASFINNKIRKLLEYIPSATTDEKIYFLRAFFDDEGCVTFENKKRVIRGYQHSLGILKIIQNLLLDFKIESKIVEKYFEIIVSQKENLIKFQKLVNFTPGVRVNGKRSNSIWKKSLEKREILKMAIDSYLN